MIVSIAGSVLFWGFLAVSSILLLPVAAALKTVTAPFDRNLVLLHRFSCFWGSLYTWCNPFLRVQISGRDKLDERTPKIYVANHQSFADILVLYRLFTHYKWVSKSENFRIPVLGWNMSLNRYIRIERGSLRGSLGMMRDCISTLRGGSSVMIFPEGTRSRSGHLGPFKLGAFELALKSGTPIQPIVIHGTGEVLPKGGFLLRGSHRIRVKILDPITRHISATPTASELAETTRSRFEAELGQMSGPA